MLFLDDGIILPASILNQTRRELVEQLDRQREQRHPVVKNYPFVTSKMNSSFDQGENEA